MKLIDSLAKQLLLELRKLDDDSAAEMLAQHSITLFNRGYEKGMKAAEDSIAQLEQALIQCAKEGQHGPN